METAALTAIVTLVENAPALYNEFKTLFSGSPPTAAQFDALRASIQAETYNQFVPATAIPAGQ